MTHLTALLSCLIGFAALALATERQQEDLFGHALGPCPTRWLRVTGWAALALALRVAVTGHGWGLGLVSFSGHTSLGAGLVYGSLVVVKAVRARATGPAAGTTRLGRRRG
jgi:hypothetical protein